jgi:hypothetical protein
LVKVKKRLLRCMDISIWLIAIQGKTNGLIMIIPYSIEPYWLHRRRTTDYL